MHSDIEIVIRDLLIAHKDNARVAAQIIERLKSEKMNRQHRKALLSFLIHIGFYSEAYELFSTWFLEKKRIPFRHFLFILHRSGFKPGKEFLKYVVKAQNELEEKDRAETFAPWEDVSSHFSQNRAARIRGLEDSVVQKRREHFDKLEFLREQRMIQEEEKLLNRLAEIYPADAEVIRRKKEFKERWARHLLAEKSLQSLEKDIFDKKPLEPEELVWADEFAKTLESLLSKHPTQAYNFSIGLNFIELYEQALRLIEHAEHSPASVWLRLELLLKARRFIDCLDDLLLVENEFANDPETTFASTYLRAQVLRGLGQTAQAIELLKSIVAIRPHYRSAHSLLMEWAEATA